MRDLSYSKLFTIDKLEEGLASSIST
ncbi:hypothetical protein [Bacillus wiedmannii]